MLTKAQLLRTAEQIVVKRQQIDALQREVSQLEASIDEALARPMSTAPRIQDGRSHNGTSIPNRILAMASRNGDAFGFAEMKAALPDIGGPSLRSALRRLITLGKVHSVARGRFEVTDRGKA